MRLGKLSAGEIARMAFRVMRPEDLLALAGHHLLRFGVRLFIPAAITAVVAMIYQLIGRHDATRLALSPLFVSGGLCAVGVLFRAVPAVLRMQHISMSEAQGLNLLTDYRKSRIGVYLHELESRVFRYEVDVHFSEDEQRKEEEEILSHQQKLNKAIREIPSSTLDWLGIEDAEDFTHYIACYRPLSEGLEKSKIGFEITAGYALRAHISQAAQCLATGYNLASVENWINGIPFHSQDVYLSRQYDSGALLKAIRSDVKAGCGLRPPYVRRAPRQMRADFMHAFWRSTILDKTQLALGGQLARLTKDFPGMDINAQTLLWPGEDQLSIYEGHPGLSKAIRQARRRLIRRVFGGTREDAYQVANRITLNNVERATELRIQYDPEYVCGLVEDSFVADLEAVGCLPNRRTAYENYVSQVRDHQNQLVLDPKWNNEEIRAARVGWHLSGRETPKTEMSAEERVAMYRKNKENISKKLVGLRSYQALTLIDRSEYILLVDALGYDNS